TPDRSSLAIVNRTLKQGFWYTSLGSVPGGTEMSVGWFVLARAKTYGLKSLLLEPFILRACNSRGRGRIPNCGCVPNGYGDPHETIGNQRNDRGRGHTPRPTGRRWRLSANLPASTPPGLRLVSAHGGKYGRSGGPDSGRLLAAVSQDRNVPGRVGLFHLAA